MRQAILRRFTRRHEGDDQGMALPLVAVMMIVLLGVSAFAVDLGWLYLNAARVQRAADSAALAGVVFLPGDTTGVNNNIFGAANANSYDIGTINNAPVAGGGPDDLDWRQLADNKLEVTLATAIPTFFVKLFGFDSFDITRVATAEYVKPVPMGSPANCFGIGGSTTDAGLVTNGVNARAVCNGYTQNFWAAMNGRRTAKEHGDPYGVECITGNGGCGGGINSDYDPNYYYGVEMPAGKTFLDVWIWDGGFYDRASFAEAGDEESLGNSASGGTNMTFTLFRPDDTPLNPTNNTVVTTCSTGGPNPTTINSGADSGTHLNRWFRLCRFAPAGGVPAGIYVVKVQNGGNIGGNNGYSIMASSNNISATSFPRLFAIDDMSIFTNSASGTATVYLAEVEPVHANKTLELSFFDPGEGAGNATMTVVPPPGVGTVSCSWTATNGSSGSTCSIPTTISGVAQFNSHWITMEIGIPTNYTCTTDCFWKMNLVLNTSHDRTTWKARVIGNPVRLVPNE